jgi:hypothetical protein
MAVVNLKAIESRGRGERLSFSEARSDRGPTLFCEETVHHDLRSFGKDAPTIPESVASSKVAESQRQRARSRPVHRAAVPYDEEILEHIAK